ncbi:M56 family metallopeptidase [Culicoidibacter larvae]|nr:M56 family metallopeptidase [Culicoidibacter larvae]
MKLILSLSVSGSLLILVIIGIRFLGQRFFKRQWLYYLWVVALLRLIIPLAPEFSLTNMIFNNFSLSSSITVGDNVTGLYQDSVVIDNGSMIIGSESVKLPNLGEPVNTVMKSTLDIFRFVWEYFWIVWLLVALICFAYRLTTYYNFARYVRAGSQSVDNPELLDLLADVCDELHIKRPIELAVNPLIASPLLLGIRKPSIVIPNEHLERSEIRYIFMHEMMHYKRKDMLYIWVTQLIVCVHWFNPLVYLLNNFIQRDRELACDEAVLSLLSDNERFGYGDTLLNSLAVSGIYKERAASLSLHENAAALKERLQLIATNQTPKKGSWYGYIATIIVLSVLCVGLGAYHMDVSGFTFSVPPNIINTGSGSDEGVELELQAFHSIDISGDVEVIIKSGEQEAVTVESGSSKQVLKVVDGILTYKPDGDTIDQINITVNNQKLYDNVTLNTGNQNISINTLKANSVYITADMGDVTFNNVQADTFEATTNMGAISMNNVHISQKTVIKAGNTLKVTDSQSGEATLHVNAHGSSVTNYLVDGHLEINNDYDLNVSDLTAGSVTINHEMGKLTLKNTIVNGDATLNSIMVGTLDFNGTVAGNINLNSENMGKVILNVNEVSNYYSITTENVGGLETLMINGQQHDYPYSQSGTSGQWITINDQNSVGTYIELNFN